jgi:hypothetical protein
MSLHTDTPYGRLAQLLCDHRVALTGDDTAASLRALEQVQAQVHAELQQARRAAEHAMTGTEDLLAEGEALYLRWGRVTLRVLASVPGEVEIQRVGGGSCLAIPLTHNTVLLLFTGVPIPPHEPDAPEGEQAY